MFSSHVIVQQGAPAARPPQVKRHASFSSRDTEKEEHQATVKRHASSRCPQEVNQCGKYGKTRAEEDARRYLQEKEQLEREKEVIRHALNALRKDRREAKEQLKALTGKQQQAGEQCVSELEEACQGKEAERVDLELRLTEVKEKLKKSLAGGVLGPPTDSKPLRKVPARKVENVYSDANTPVNCAAEMRRRPPSMYASARGNVMQKAKEWESKRGT